MSNSTFNPEKYIQELSQIVTKLLSDTVEINETTLNKTLKQHPKDKSAIFSKDQLISGIRYLEQNNLIATLTKEKAELLITKIKMKPTRSISGVTTVTILTKPFACPGRCIFCPNDVRMPKSYIASEPGAQRALDNKFDPYLQVYSRLMAYKNIGHPIDKIELLILGGTWSYYTKKYKIWFIHQCFKAMNEFGINEEIEKYLVNRPKKTSHPETIEKDELNVSLRNKYGDTPYNQLLQKNEYKVDFKDKYVCQETEITIDALKKEQDKNTRGKVRCVGLVLETRSDVIDEKEVLLMRQLGATKVQLGIQTLDDEISEMNDRGETKEQVANAFRLLRSGGFKIHGHIMPNLYGSTPEIDFRVYKELFDSPSFKPDELKIYPTSIIKFTRLHDLWEEGRYKPYETEVLVDLLAKCIEYTPQYCRLTRIIRDIPSTEIADGNMTTNLREVVEFILKKQNRKNENIRAREIRDKQVGLQDLSLDIVEYQTSNSTEYFLQFVTEKNEIAGFLRLSLPDFGNIRIVNEQKTFKNPISDELNDCAIIREVHVYGPSLELDDKSTGQAQHIGLGTKLIEKAKEIAKEKLYSKLAVISAIGTKEYYAKRGFTDTGAWMVAYLDNQ